MTCVSAEKCVSVSKKGFICNDCHAPVFLVLDKFSTDAPQTPRFFRHVVENAGCGYSIRNPAKTASSAPVAPAVCKPPNALWLHKWASLNPASSAAWVLRDTSANSVAIDDDMTQIFDATHVKIYEYTGFLYNQKRLYFCIDEYLDKTPTGSTLWHTSDGQLLDSCCYDSKVTVLCDGMELTVRFLTPLDKKTTAELDSRFGKTRWPPSLGSKQRLVQVQHPLQVLSVDGRMFVDYVHRAAFEVMPTRPLTVYNACPGAGKSTAIKQVVRLWKNKKILVVVFNKSNQEALQAELKGKKGCIVRTLDALIASVTKCRFEPTYGNGGDDEEQERLQAECVETQENEMESEDPSKMYDNCSSDMEEDGHQSENDDMEDVKEDLEDGEESLLDFDANFSDASFSKSCYENWHHSEHMKYGGGGGAASLMQARLTHPKAKVSICKFHARLSLRHDSDKATPWTGCHSTFPLKRIIDSQSSFAARRFIADRDKKLADVLGKYDIIAVDEYQDSNSNQEVRLIMQSDTPVVFLGDSNQSVNNFRHQINDSRCDKRSPCKFPVEMPHAAMPVHRCVLLRQQAVKGAPSEPG